MATNAASIETSDNTRFAGKRFHDMDALRAWAMSMGIVLHAAWIMIPGEAGAPATDASAGAFYEWMCLAIHTFRMQLFFVLAGFFACLLLRKRGQRRFLANRVMRIGVPLVLFWLILCPIMMFQYNAAGLNSGAIQSSSSAWQLTKDYFANITIANTMLLHLWFLYYLFCVYAIAISARAVIRLVDRRGQFRNASSRWFAVVITKRWNVFVLALISAPLLWVMNGCWGIEIGLNTLYPEWPGLLSYLTFFLIGWLIFRNVDQLSLVVSGWRWQLVAGLLLTIPYFFYAQVVTRNGYTTWNYPDLTVECLRYDDDRGEYAYRDLRNALFNAEPGSVAFAVWQGLPELNRKFVEGNQVATHNQLNGVLTAITTNVLVDAKFSRQFDLAQIMLPSEILAIDRMPQPDRSVDETKRLNRAILEAGFTGIIHAEDVHLPYYYLIRTAYAYGYSLITWLLIFGCIGCFRAICSKESRFWRYYSDASYWMYVAHLPIQFQLLLWFGDQPWPGIVKFSMYVFGTIAILIPSYHFLVRSTWIGLLLNGRMVPISRRTESPTREPSRLHETEYPDPITVG